MLKHKFETWLEGQTFSKNVQLLFVESIKCYKADAERAALLFSYLAFLNILKERLLRAHKPSIYEQGKWDKMIKQLRNDEKWEEALLNATQELEVYSQNPDPVTKLKPKTRDAVFAIRSTVRVQIAYWKDRRNDCAHAKENIINNFHVENFWSFLESNLAKITVEGGKDSLLKKIARHYDSTYTPIGEDITPLLQEIDSSVETNELEEFWNVSLTIINENAWHLDNEDNKFIQSVFALQIPRLSNSLLEFLKQKANKRTLRDYLSFAPLTIAQLDYTADEIRNFWHTTLLRTDKPLSIYAAMLATGLIPEREINEAHELIVREIGEVPYPDKPEEHAVLYEKGFGEVIRRIAFEEDAIGPWQWSHKKHPLLVGFIEKYPLTPQVVEKLCDIYTTNTHQRLGRGLEPMFGRNEQKKAEFVRIATNNAYALPEYLPSLAQ